MTEQQQKLFTARQVVAYARRYSSRMQLSRDVGQHTAYNGGRQYYDVLGYPSTIEIEVYSQRYNRQDIAGRVVDLPAQDTWRKPPEISEDGDTTTDFAQAWEELTKSDLGVWGKLSRADKLSGIGEFGILLMGLSDGAKKLEEPVNVDQLDGIEDLLYLRPVPQGDTQGTRVDIVTFNNDIQSRRYGMPEMYNVKLEHTGGMQRVHWSRIIHLAENKTTDEVYGTPRLERVYNRLDDLIKFIGGNAEATWLNMRPGTLLGADPDFDGSDITDEEIEEQMENYVNDPMRMLYIDGYRVQQVGSSEVADTSSLFDSTLALIASASGIPQRVLIGSAQGEVAAAEWDQKQWAGQVDFRQKNYAEPEVLRPFINRLIEFGILPEPDSGSYNVGEKTESEEWHWPFLLEMTDAELAQIQNSRANSAAVLSDPLADYPINENEKRELVGFSPVEEDEAEPETEPDDDSDAITDMVMNMAMRNYGAEQITAEQAAEFSLAVMEGAGANG